MSKLVLIIEDNPGNMKLFHDILQANGFTTAGAADGKSGLDLARQRLPDLILLDIMLPEMTGLEVCRALKSDERTRSVPVIAISSFAMAGDREKAIEAGCDGYMTKPIDVKEFVKTVKEYMD